MSFKLLGPLLITTVVAVLGWYVVNHLNARRELRNTIIELRIKYLLEVYRRLVRVLGAGLTREILDDVETALDDLQLVGSERQVRLAREQVHKLGGKYLHNLDINDLLFDLRSTLRQDLNLESVDHLDLRHLRLELTEKEEQKP
jgi:hypothetical protein